MGSSWRRGPTLRARLCHRKEVTGGFLGAGKGGLRGAGGGRPGGVSAPQGASEQAVLGSGLEPLISKLRVTWMPGIPEPGAVPLCPHRPAPPRPRCGRDTGTKGLGSAGGALLSQEKGPAPCSLHSSPRLPASPGPPYIFPGSSPTPCLGAPLPTRQAQDFIPVSGDGLGLRPPSPCWGLRSCWKPKPESSGLFPTG